MTSTNDSQEASGLSRRTVVRGAAWSVPVVSVAATAPAYAASRCAERSNFATTSTVASGSPTATGWARGADGISGSWRTNDPDGTGTTYSNVRIAVTQSRTSSNILYGFQQASQNLVAPWTASTVTGLTINQRPASTDVQRGIDNRTTTRFDFGRPVYDLSFTVADISKQGSLTGTIGFWDAVWIESDGTFRSTLGNEVTGDGSRDLPFTATDNASDTDDSATSNVSLTFTSRATYVNLHYWSSQRRPLNSDSGGGQGITISNMSMKLAPDGCL